MKISKEIRTEKVWIDQYVTTEKEVEIKEIELTTSTNNTYLMRLVDDTTSESKVIIHNTGEVLDVTYGIANPKYCKDYRDGMILVPIEMGGKVVAIDKQSYTAAYNEIMSVKLERDASRDKAEQDYERHQAMMRRAMA